MAKPNKNEVVETKTNLPTVDVQDYADYAGQGFESHTRDDYAVPFLGVLQSNSPQIENIADARAGMLINTVTNQVFDGKKGVTFIPVDTQHSMIEWKPREQGGGFVAVHKMDSELVKNVKANQEFGKYKSVKGETKSNDLIETFYVYGLLVQEDGSAEQSIITFSSTKIKVYKGWMTKAFGVRINLPNGERPPYPLYAHQYHISTVLQKNAKGSFYNLQIDWKNKDAVGSRLATKDPLFQQANEFFKIIRESNIKVAYDTVASTDAIPEDNDVPFA